SGKINNDKIQKEQKPSSPSPQVVKPVTFATGDKLCLLWLGNGKSRHEKAVSFLQAVSNGGSSSSDNVIVMPNALRGKITGSVVEQYLTDKNNQGLLMTFTLKKGLFSRERIHFLDYETCELNDAKEFQTVIILDYETIATFKSSKETVASLRGLIGCMEDNRQSTCLVIVLKEQSLISSPFFNNQAQEQVKTRFPGVGRGEMARILLNEMLEKCGLMTELDRLGKIVSYKLTSLNELQSQLKNYVSPRS
ncbi:MAG: hypothetical protein IJS15_11970, partial [Victivallales bacterium]|nr:hypothetical protein [Victivallales bacterium]